MHELDQLPNRPTGLPDAPVCGVRVRSRGGLVVRVECPYCDGTHRHGAQQGARLASCGGGAYWITPRRSLAGGAAA